MSDHTTTRRLGRDATPRVPHPTDKAATQGRRPRDGSTSTPELKRVLASDSATVASDAASKRQDTPTRQKHTRTPASSTVVVAVIAALVGAAWGISKRMPYSANDKVGYWLGVAGGVMMLLLLLYPLRKRIKALQAFGPVKVWLWTHMALGIGAPLLILVHCKFQAQSLNAAAALYSMLVVAVSGVMGRFLYVRVNGGLAAAHEALTSRRAWLASERSSLHRLPTSRDALTKFETEALQASAAAGRSWFKLVTMLPCQSWVSRFRVMARVREELASLASERRWDDRKLAQRRKSAQEEVVAYYVSVMRVALFAAWERLFALWHVAHTPFAFLLLIAGVVHVVAVHAY